MRLFPDLLRRVVGNREPETRDRVGANGDPSWLAVAASVGQMPLLGDPRMAEGLATIYGCVQVISSAIASLPARVYRPTADGRGREEDPGSPLAQLIAQGPNPHQSWADFLEWLVAQALLYGNGLVEIDTADNGRTVALWPVHWPNVAVLMLPNNSLRYDVTDPAGMRGHPGNVRRLLADDVLHLRDRSDDGLVGRSRLSRAGATVAAALTIQAFCSSMFANGVHPSGVIQTDKVVGDTAMKRLAVSFADAFGGSHNAAKALVLDQGLKWSSISVSPEDQELLDSRRFSAEELARIYGVPPPLVGIWDRSTFTNSETAGRWLATYTLRPWVTKLEALLTRQLLSNSRRVEIDMSGLLRGDEQARWQTYDIALKNRVLTVNEIRDLEGFNPLPGGDVPAGTGPAEQP